MKSVIIFFVAVLLSWTAYSSPSDPSRFYVLQGQMMNIEDGAYVQGSSGNGGLQPDYYIDLKDSSIRQVLELATEMGRQPEAFWERVQKISDLVGLRVLKRGSYVDPEYLKLMETHRIQSQDVPLAAYVQCGAGVCRENGMLLHLALKAAGIPNNYVYADVSLTWRGETRSEGHGFTVVLHDGKNYVVDSYNSSFNGAILEDLLKPEGTMRNETRVVINRINSFPLVWNPKQTLHSVIGKGFISAPTFAGPDINVGEFVEPNELHPDVAHELYRAGSRGVHISVGSERGYIGFAMNPQASHLLLADIDAQVVRFNKINIALLQLSDGFADYKNLRFATTHETWLEKMHSGLAISVEMGRVLTDPAIFEWWQERVAQSKSSQAKTEVLGLNSYLNDPGKFHRIYAAAKAGRIQSLRLNLVDPSQLNVLAEEFRNKGLTISLLDISSAWMPRYITNTGVLTLLTSLKSVFSDNSVLMLTKGDRAYGHWKYAAFTGSYIKSAGLKKLEGERIQKMFDSYEKPLLFVDTKMSIYKSKVLLWVEKYILPRKAPLCSQIF